MASAEQIPWHFDQPRNCAVFTIRQILEGSEPILRVRHDLDDHGWVFLGDGDTTMVDAMLVRLESVVRLDRSVLEVADLPPGWQAWRTSPDLPWTREVNLVMEADDE